MTGLVLQAIHILTSNQRANQRKSVADHALIRAVIMTGSGHSKSTIAGTGIT